MVKIYYYFAKIQQNTWYSATKFWICGENCTQFLIKLENYHLSSAVKNYHEQWKIVQCYAKISKIFGNGEFHFIKIKISAKEKFSGMILLPSRFFSTGFPYFGQPHPKIFLIIFRKQFRFSYLTCKIRTNANNSEWLGSYVIWYL